MHAEPNLPVVLVADEAREGVGARREDVGIGVRDHRVPPVIPPGNEALSNLT